MDLLCNILYKFLLKHLEIFDNKKKIASLVYFYFTFFFVELSPDRKFWENKMKYSRLRLIDEVWSEG